MQVWNLLHAGRWKCRTQKCRQKSPSGHHRTTLSGYIFATKAHIDNRKKNLLSSDMPSTCPQNMVNFSLLTAEIHPVVWGTLQISTGFASWQRYCTASSSGREPNFAALNRGCHLCSAGWPSGWTLAHILVMIFTVFDPSLLTVCINCSFFTYIFVMVALCNRADHYIFVLFLLSSFFFSSPNLSSRRLDVYHALAHGVALVRI